MTKRILIADDNLINRTLMKGALHKNYEILEAENGEDALSIILDGGEQLSAVLLDIGMPVMDGFEVLRQMRSVPKLSQLPVIVVTGSDDDDTRIEALSRGANDFITKPFSPKIVRHCLQNSIALSELSSTVSALRRDKLTGLLNRETFFEQVTKRVSERDAGYYKMSSFDIEHFKIINEQYGNDTGDAVLRKIAEIWQTALEPFDGICCRIAADNFAAIYPCSFSDSSHCEDMQLELAKPDRSLPSVVYCVGTYVIDDTSLTASAMYDRAVMAKLSVKGRYDVHIACYEDSMRERILREQQIVTEMHSAITKRQFEAWFQPQYNHTTGALIGAEALVRWRHPQKGLIPPGVFIPVFEQNGFVYELDKYVWDDVCRHLRKWIDEGEDPLPVSVNISRYDIFRDDLVSVITGLIKKYELPVDLLRLEITESAFSKSSKQIITVVKSLMDFGFTVEIDDFGSGYSSLNTLKDVPAQILKLDMKFLESSENSQRGGNIVESIVRMAKWLGMSVIAEGVETREQADFLKSIGCSYVQGYLYAKPMPGTDYEALFKSSRKGERLLALETVENLDNSAFWDPTSMDTLIFNSYVGGACILEYHNDEIELLRANDKYIRIFDKHTSAEGVFASRASEYLDQGNKRIITDCIRRAIETNQESTCETVIYSRHATDKPAYIRSTIRVIARSGERYLLYGSAIDMSEQREAERNERELAGRISAIMSNINGGVTAIVLDGEDPRILFSNEQFYKQLGYTKEQFESEVSNAFDLIFPEDRSRVAAEAVQASLNKHAFSTSYRAVCRDGSVRWMSGNISITSLPGESRPVQIAVTTDVTEEKENALKMDELLNAIPGGVVIYRIGETIETLYSSDGVIKLTGISDEEYDAWKHGDLIASAIYEEDAPAVRAELITAVASDSPINMIFRLKHCNGGVVWVEFSATKIREDKHGKIYYGIFTKPANEAALYQSLTEDSPKAVVILEKRNRKVLYANPAWKKIQDIPSGVRVTNVYLSELIHDSNMFSPTRKYAIFPTTIIRNTAGSTAPASMSRFRRAPYSGTTERHTYATLPMKQSGCFARPSIVNGSKPEKYSPKTNTRRHCSI